MDLRHRPRRHRHPGGRREEPRRPGHLACRARARGVHPPRLGVEGRIRRHDHRPAAPTRLHARLRARALHHGRRLRLGRAPRVRGPVREGLHLPRPVHGQLGSGPRLGHLRPGGRGARGHRHPRQHRLPAHRRQRRGGGGHGAARDDARRHRRGRESRRRALSRPDRQERHVAPGGPRDPDRGRLLRPDRVRHRRAQGDARPRPQRLRDRAPARPGRDRRHRRGRPHDGRGRRLRGAHAGRGLGARGRRPAGPGPDPRRGAVHAHGPLLAPLGRARRAPGLAAVVLRHDPARRAGDHRGRGRPGALHAAQVGRGVPQLDARDPPVVRQPPALVGPPAAGLVPRRRGLRGPRGARGRRLGARRGRARHLVQLGAVALRHARLARPDARARQVLPHAGALDGPRHHLPVGGPHGDDGHRVPRHGALLRRLYPLGGAGAPTGGA